MSKCLVQGHTYLVGLEPPTLRLRVKSANHYTTVLSLPHGSYGIYVAIMRCAWKCRGILECSLDSHAESPGSNLTIAAALLSFSKAIYHHCCSLLLGFCNAFPWRSFCLEAGAAPQGVQGGGGQLPPYDFQCFLFFVFLLVNSAVSHGHDDDTPTPLWSYFLENFLKSEKMCRSLSPSLPPPPPTPLSGFFRDGAGILGLAQQ